MVKRKSVKEIIESTSNPHKEVVFIKYPGKKVEDISFTRGKGYVYPNLIKLAEINKRGGRYTQIHTHPENAAYLPSEGDLFLFLTDDKLKTMTIAQRDSNTGNVLGYEVIRKTKDTPKTGVKNYHLSPPKRFFHNLTGGLFFVPEIEKQIIKDIYSLNAGISGMDPYENNFRKLVKKYNLQEKTVSFSKEHNDSRYRLQPKETKSRLEPRGGLEKAAVTASIICLVSGAFFLSSNMTGNVIGLSSSSSNIIGSVLLVIGLVACFSWVKSKKKLSKKKKK